MYYTHHFPCDRGRENFMLLSYKKNNNNTKKELEKGGGFYYYYYNGVYVCVFVCSVDAYNIYAIIGSMDEIRVVDVSRSSVIIL